MGNQGLIKHTAQPSAQGRLVASTSVLAIRGAPAAAPAGAGEGADTRLASSTAGGLFPITQRLEEEATIHQPWGQQKVKRIQEAPPLSGSAAECLDKGTNVGTKPGLGAVQ